MLVLAQVCLQAFTLHLLALCRATYADVLLLFASLCVWRALHITCRCLFQRGCLDVFILKGLPDVGPLTHLTIGHDGAGPQPGALMIVASLVGSSLTYLLVVLVAAK